MIKKDLKEFSNTFTVFKDECPILTCSDGKDVNAMMVNWGGTGYLWNKNVCFVFVRKDRYTYQFSEKAKMFSLSFVNLTDDITDVFGKQSGKDVDKFKISSLHKCYDVDNNVYSIAEANKVLKLVKLARIDLENSTYYNDNIIDFYKDKPYHVLYICEIKQYLVGEENE